jgi:fatty acid desaturase
LKAAGTFFLKRDELRLGLLLGLLAPMLLFFIIYQVRFSHYNLGEFFHLFPTEKRLITFFGAWCLVGNIALFTAYVNTGRDRTARGIFIVSLIYGIGVLLAKAVL